MEDNQSREATANSDDRTVGEVSEEARRAQIRRELLAPPRRETMMSAGRGAGATRPPRTYVTGPWTRRLRIASIAIIAAAVLFTLIRFPFLPETIPTHFNLLGEPDGWGPRASVLPLAGIAVAMTGGMVWVSFYPRIYNYLREVTPENAQRQYRLGEQMMVGVTLGLALMYAGILLATGAGLSTMTITLPGLLLTIGALVWGLVRLGRM